jgi:hypothetical protein
MEKNLSLTEVRTYGLGMLVNILKEAFQRVPFVNRQIN